MLKLKLSLSQVCGYNIVLMRRSLRQGKLCLTSHLSETEAVLNWLDSFGGSFSVFSYGLARLKHEERYLFFNFYVFVFVLEKCDEEEEAGLLSNSSISAV